jgi:hypothetical protein
MQTFPPPNLPATHRPTSLYPERRMARNRRPESGARKQSLDCPLALLGPLCVALRGRIGNRVYKTYGEKIIITRVPRFDGYVPSAAQRERRDRMRAATAFAQSVYADPAAKAVYVAAAKSLGRRPFRLAVSDFLHGRTRIPPFVPCMAPSPETPADLAQGSHAADVQPRGSRELTPAPQPGPAAARVRRSRRVNMTRTPSPSRRARFAGFRSQDLRSGTCQVPFLCGAILRSRRPSRKASTDAKSKRGRERAPIRCRDRPLSVSVSPSPMHALLGLIWVVVHFGNRRSCHGSGR